MPRVPVAPDLLEARARAAMSREAFAYVAGGAGTERTLAANRDAFARHRLVPRMLHGASEPDTTRTLFGMALPTPLLLAPIGALDLVQTDADLAVGQAAAALGVPYVSRARAATRWRRRRPRWTPCAPRRRAFSSST